MNLTRRTLVKTAAAAAAAVSGFPAIAQGKTKVKVGYLHTPAVDGQSSTGQHRGSVAKPRRSARKWACR